jgi:hypothetical protein
MKYISYSLWGDSPIYNIGMIKNAEQAKIFYPSWKVIVYYDNSVPIETIQKLIEFDVMCIDATNLNLYGMFWRFLASDLPDCEYVIFRDSDSRLSQRESMAVSEWINSGKTLHVMRDHPYHMVPCGNDRLGILGGMWGIKGNVLPITEMINRFPKSKEKKYGNDQTFLKEVFFVFEEDRLTHDEFFEINPFPIPRENGRFIGERINIDEEPLTDDYKMLIK